MKDEGMNTIINPQFGEITKWFTPWGVFDRNGLIDRCSPPDEHHWSRGELCVCGVMIWPDGDDEPRFR